MNAQHQLADYQNLELRTRISEASPHELIQMLFDGYKKNISSAKVWITNNNIEQKGRMIEKATNIILSLQKCLDHEKGGELAENLNELYDYIVRRHQEAHVKNDIAILDECYRLIDEIAGAWAQIKPEVEA